MVVNYIDCIVLYLSYFSSIFVFAHTATVVWFIMSSLYDFRLYVFPLGHEKST